MGVSPMHPNRRDEILRLIELGAIYAEDGAPATAAAELRTAIELLEQEAEERRRLVARLPRVAS